jgi:hypothetical protein
MWVITCSAASLCSNLVVANLAFRPRTCLAVQTCAPYRRRSSGTPARTPDVHSRYSVLIRSCERARPASGERAATRASTAHMPDSVDTRVWSHGSQRADERLAARRSRIVSARVSARATGDQSRATEYAREARTIREQSQNTKVSQVTKVSHPRKCWRGRRTRRRIET